MPSLFPLALSLVFAMSARLPSFVGLILTVIRWIDSGRLPGYKIPGSRTRRVQPKDLLTFMRHYGLPIPSELECLDVTVKTEGKQI